MIDNLTIIKCEDKCQKELKRFYKANRYPVSFMGYDHAYIAKVNSKLVASLIISYINQNNPQGLLHALLTSKKYQKRGYAKQLIKHVIKDHKQLVCFADKELEVFYKKINFSKKSSADISPIIIPKYCSYLKKNKNLKVFTCED